MTTIDLRNCKPGDKLESANGKSAEYVGPFGNHVFPHCVKMNNRANAWFTDTGRFDSVRITNSDIVKVTHMTTQPDQIPQLNHAIALLEAVRDGKKLQLCLDGHWANSGLNIGGVIHALYIAPDKIRIATTPPAKTRRYETREEFMLLVPSHGNFLVRRKSDGEISTAYFIVSKNNFYIHVHTFSNIGQSNFSDYEKSLDGGKSWVDCGVEE